MKYTKVAAHDDGNQDAFCVSEVSDLETIDAQIDQPEEIFVCGRNLVPISHPPTKGRDNKYFVIFAIFSFCVLILSNSFSSQQNSGSSFIDREQCGSWSSVLMSSCLVGSLLGIGISYMFSSSLVREFLLVLSVPVSVFLHFSGGCAIVILGGDWKYAGVLFLTTACSEFLWSKQAFANTLSTSALLGASFDILKIFSPGILLFSFGTFALHSCVIVWLSAIFVNLISEPVSILLILTLLLLFLLFHWVTQFLQSLLGFVVGGCVLWHILSDEYIPDEHSSGDHASGSGGNSHHGERTRDGSGPVSPSARVRRSWETAARVNLYTKCACTTSLGSIAKCALYCPVSDLIVTLIHWWTSSSPSGNPLSRCWGRNTTSPLSPHHPWTPILQICLYRLGRYNRLAVSVLAVFSKTLCRASDEIAALPDIDRLSRRDSSGYHHLNYVTTAAAMLVTALLALLTERKEGSAWPLFICACYVLVYRCASLPVHVYQSAVDALLVAYGLCPMSFLKAFPILYQRFYRIVELAEAAEYEIE